MTMEDLIAKLKERPKSVDDHREQQKQEWREAVKALMQQVEDWVAPAVREGVLQVSSTTMDLDEADFGSYLVPVRTISDGIRSLRIEPIGGRVVATFSSGGVRHHGLKGRVDLISGATKIPLVRDRTGKWMALPLRGEPRELDEESFTEILREILIGE